MDNQGLTTSASPKFAVDLQGPEAHTWLRSPGAGAQPPHSELLRDADVGDGAQGVLTGRSGSTCYSLSTL